ncbi:MAG TPA: hypothetical protein VGK48_02910 [Terriglobia bacterium]|jgi:hypothetical protein
MIGHWLRQTLAVARFELRRFLLARRWIGIYVMALAPVLLMYIRSRMRVRDVDVMADATQSFSFLFELFILQFGVFISCAVVFTQVFRGDILEKTLHLYLLTPVRREIIAAGKYIAGVVLVSVLFAGSTAASLLLRYSENGVFNTFFFEGPGLFHLTRYVAVAVLATMAYGAVFLLIGLLFKNPGLPILFLLGWESLSFALPPILQRMSVVYYLLPILPVKVDRGPLAILIDPVSPLIGVPLILGFAVLVVAVSGWFVRSVQITYSAD